MNQRSAPTLSYDAYQRTRRFPLLDGLRGIAVLMVIVYHSPGIDLFGVSALQHAGQFGVDVFFVLSGFLITTLLLREPDGPRLPRLRGFYLRRVLRIFPLYYLAIGLYWIAARVSSDPAADALYEQSLPYFLTFNIDMLLGQSPSPAPKFAVAWSLGVEEKFYLLWPFVVMFFKPRRIAMIGSGLILAAALWRMRLIEHYAGNLAGRLVFSFDTRMDCIIWGCVLAALLHDRAWFTRLSQIGHSPIIVPIVAMTACVTWWTLENDTAVRYIAPPLLITCALLCLLLRPEQPASRLLHQHVLSYLGRISYGMYIMHPLCISCVLLFVTPQMPATSLLTIAAIVLFTTAISAMSFRYIESPFLHLKDRLSRHRSPETNPAAIGRPA